MKNKNLMTSVLVNEQSQSLKTGLSTAMLISQKNKLIKKIK